jgi:hypothetical protein
MKILQYREGKVIDLGRASVETKGAGIVFLDSSGGQRNAAPGCLDD